MVGGLLLSVATALLATPGSALRRHAKEKPETCDAQCGATYNSSLTCQCDYGCKRFNNCCRDFGTLCTAPKDSCVRIGCGTRDVKAYPCQCDADCAKAGTCCSDYVQSCGKKQFGSLIAAPPSVQPVDPDGKTGEQKDAQNVLPEMGGNRSAVQYGVFASVFILACGCALSSRAD